MMTMTATGLKCDRCDATIHGDMPSWFNEDALCAVCYDDEQRHSTAAAARARWQAAHDAGDLDFPGVGVPPELVAAGAFRRAVRLTTQARRARVYNTTPYHTPLLDALAYWVSEQCGVALPRTPIQVRSKSATARGRISGLFYHVTGGISIRLGNPSDFPRRYHNHGLQRCTPFVMEDWAEGFVYVLTHELTHKRQHQDGEGHRARQFAEQEADHVGQAVVATYRAMVPIVKPRAGT